VKGKVLRAVQGHSAQNVNQTIVSYVMRALPVVKEITR